MARIDKFRRGGTALVIGRIEAAGLRTRQQLI
jgi:hypothetical protein